MDEIVEEFLAESHEDLERLDLDLAGLERLPGAPDLLESIFRTLHTIKGSSGLLDLPRLQAVTHAGEDLLARLRDGSASMTPAATEVLMEVVDVVRELLAAVAVDGTEGSVAVEPVVGAVTRLLTDDLPDRVDPVDLGPLVHVAAELTLYGARMATELADHLWRDLPRVVDELGAQCGKHVDVVVAASGAELDPALLEAVREPFVHLVRNAVDHGLELSKARVALGKPAVGRLTLGVSRRGDQVVVEVADDGAGIDPALVSARARLAGLRSADQLARMSDDELLDLVFLPGFSTASAVTHVSGRGVGMDVVRTTVEALGGTVELDSVVGRGTTCRLRIPTSPGTAPRDGASPVGGLATVASC